MNRGQFGSARTGPWPLELQSSVKNEYLAMILCMWSDPMYQRRERPGSHSEKIKRRLIIDGIFVVVAVLEAVGRICMCYAHPVLDRFLSYLHF
jgi:hypothetical protein